MQKVQIYTTRTCGYCFRAKSLFESKRVPYDEISVDGDRQARMQLMARTGQHTVPQIWIGEKHIGGCQELFALEASGNLDKLIMQ